MMSQRRRRHTLEQIIRKLCEGEKLLGQGAEFAPPSGGRHGASMRGRPRCGQRLRGISRAHPRRGWLKAYYCNPCELRSALGYDPARCLEAASRHRRMTFRAYELHRWYAGHR